MVTKDEIDSISIKTIEDLDAEVELMLHDFVDWRRGQAYYNTFAFCYPEMAQKLNCTEYDCFHSDLKIEKFRQKVKEFLDDLHEND